MADNAKKVSGLPVANTVASTDRVAILADPAGVPIVKTAPLAALAANLTFSNSAPATSSSNGVAGTIRYDNTHIYVCIANNTWMRASVTTW